MKKFGKFTTAVSHASTHYLYRRNDFQEKLGKDSLDIDLQRRLAHGLMGTELLYKTLQSLIGSFNHFVENILSEGKERFDVEKS